MVHKVHFALKFACVELPKQMNEKCSSQLDVFVWKIIINLNFIWMFLYKSKIYAQNRKKISVKLFKSIDAECTGKQTTVQLL